MMLKKLELEGFKSFAKKSVIFFDTPITAIVGPNGSGKSNTVEALRFVLGEQSAKSLRSKTGADLIFKGSKGRSQAKEASVLLSFDNTARVCAISGDDGKPIPIDTDIVTVGRTVSLEGGNEYTINGSSVRLKDVHDMIARLNIGSSGHHIISQGEADRLLYARPKDRKDMLEESLGLRLYQYRLKEARKKLDRTRDLVHEVDVMKRELSPQLRFLKKQVEKIEKAEQTARELKVVWEKYSVMVQDAWNKEEGEALALLRQVEEKLNAISRPKQATRNQDPLHDLHHKEQIIENSLRTIDEAISTIERTIGRTEGALEMLSAPAKPVEKVSDSITLSRSQAKTLLSQIKDAHKAFSNNTIELSIYLSQISQYIEELEALVGGEAKEVALVVDDSKKTELQSVLSELSKEKETKLGEKASVNQELASVRAEIASCREKIHEEDKENQALLFQEQSLRHEKDALSKLLAKISEEKAALLVDTERVRHMTDLVTLQSLQEVTLPAELVTALDFRRYAERLMVRIEDSGAGGGGDVISEFNTLSEREQFLDKELSDLSKAEADLVALENELRQTIEVSFESGIKRINDAFSELFKAMFGGGDAQLILVSSQKSEEGEEGGESVSEEVPVVGFDGVEIDVKLPRKNVKDIEMLSGGERSLTSIALLFALSAVNPPPFLVLDETDAALDEANSKKYGDMIERLSEKTQLVVVTHNRETMSRAQTLYGVTLGSDDSSMLLTVKFDEAVAVAK